MEEHPIPQEVSTYEFRLVGDMTIKQFIQVAAGALIALVLYSSHIAPYVKWPLIIISFLTGIALAFFPIEDRPLSKWIVLFIKAIYSPTIYVWDKNSRKYDFFQPEPVATAQIGQTGNQAAMTQANNQLQTPQAGDSSTKLDKKEQEFLSKVNSQFSTASQPPVAPMPVLHQTPTQVSNASQGRGIRREAKKITVPKAEELKVEKQKKDEPFAESLKSKTQTNVGEQITPIASQKISGAKEATFSQEASPPSPPTKPNVIVGQVLSSDGKIIDGAILEIRDSDGRPVRALRSNRLGHFMIVTPLTNGDYEITTEKEGYNFDPVTFNAKDTIIPPIAIWAKNQ
jgi:hypothetical protein